MFNILVDTCVWLDTAKEPEQQQLLSVIESLIELAEIRLIVPSVVPAEFARNKERIVKESGRSLSSHLKRVKEAVRRFGDDSTMSVVLEHLNDVDYRIPQIGHEVNKSIERIEALLANAEVMDVDASIKARAADRAIEKRAPFHRNKNSINDAILIEVYADVSRKPARGQRFAFVTHNTNDFSDPAGNNKSPHPDLASLFSPRRSLYFISLAEAVHRVRPDLVSDLMLEYEDWVDEPRSLAEILDATEELTDKIWYDRHQLLLQRIEDGRTAIVEKFDPGAAREGRDEITKEVLAGARKSAEKVAGRYGRENLGPWTKFEWGMLNGKLSALRWVLGDEWDMLDT